MPLGMLPTIPRFLLRDPKVRLLCPASRHPKQIGYLLDELKVHPSRNNINVQPQRRLTKGPGD